MVEPTKHIDEQHAFLWHHKDFYEGYKFGKERGRVLATNIEELRKFSENHAKGAKYLKDPELLHIMSKLIRKASTIELSKDAKATYGMDSASEVLGYITAHALSLMGEEGAEHIKNTGIILANLHPLILKQFLEDYVLPVTAIPNVLVEGGARNPDVQKILTRIQMKAAIRTIPSAAKIIRERIQPKISESDRKKAALEDEVATLRARVRRMEKIITHITKKEFKNAKEVLKEHIEDIKQKKEPHQELEKLLEQEDVEGAKKVAERIKKTIAYTLEEKESELTHMANEQISREKVKKLLENLTNIAVDFGSFVETFDQSDVTKLDWITDMDPAALKRVETVLDRMNAKIPHTVRIMLKLKNRILRKTLEKAVKWAEKMDSGADKKVDAMIELLARGDDKFESYIHKRGHYINIDEILEVAQKRYDELKKRNVMAGDST